MTTRPPTVDSIDEDGGWLVARETDEVKALDLVIAKMLTDYECEPDGVDEVRQGLMARAGWWRKQPCNCGGDHRWDMATAEPHARGAFPGTHVTR